MILSMVGGHMYRCFVVIILVFLSVSVFAQKIDYWTCSMHPSVRSDKPGKCPLCGMALIPVYKETPIEEKVYYGCGVKEEGHCPHCDEGKPDKRCICGGHTFVIEGEVLKNCPVCGKSLKKLEQPEAVVSRVRLSKQQIELGGIRTEQIQKRRLFKQIRTVGKVAYDPELVVAQEEFITALETREKVGGSKDPDVINRADDIVNKSKVRLRLLGMSDSEIDRLAEGRKTDRGLILPEEKVWVYAEVYEYEMGWVKVGEIVKITATAFPGEEFSGVIRSISPVLDPKTRSAKVRIEVENPAKKLQPEMYVDVFIESAYMDRDVLAVPVDAVLDTGTRKIVYIDTGEGKYIGREIKTGPEAVDSERNKFYPVITGVVEGELLVVKGNFLIDSQSQLTGGMSVLWGGATEVKEEAPSGGHRH